MEKTKEDVAKEEVKLTKQELTNLSQLLFTGKWNLSMQESRQVIEPIMQKLAVMIDLMK